MLIQFVGFSIVISEWSIMSRSALFVVALFFVLQVDAIPIDNGVEGDPEVQCLGNAIQINFNTQNAFEGNVYVNHHFADPACKVAGGAGNATGGNIGSITVPFDACGTTRERSLQPRGVFVRTSVVISFHPRLVTKVDRAFTVQCFYMEADKTVSQELEVSMLTTVLQTLTVPMPVCRYEILSGGPNGTAVRFVLVGDQVYHKWTCDSDTADTFCMVVYDCFVDDGEGDKIQLLDQEGCAQDKHLLNNLEYPTDLMAGQEAHVFKYADRSNIYFNCQIRITIKEPGQECARPTCAEAPRRRRGARIPARSRREESPDDLIVDVSYKNEILVGDVDLTENDIPASLRQPLNRGAPGSSVSVEADKTSLRGYCMSAAGFGVFMSFAAVFTVGAIFMTLMLCMNKSKVVY